MSPKCPGCNYALKFSQSVDIDQVVICSNCGAALEVVWLYPLTLEKISKSNPDPDPKKDLKYKIKKDP